MATAQACVFCRHLKRESDLKRISGRASSRSQSDADLDIPATIYQVQTPCSMSLPQYQHSPDHVLGPWIFESFTSENAYNGSCSLRFNQAFDYFLPLFLIPCAARAGP